MVSDWLFAVWIYRVFSANNDKQQQIIGCCMRADAHEANLYLRMVEELLCVEKIRNVGMTYHRST